MTTKEKILDYLYEVNARCDYKLEEVAEDILDIVVCSLFDMVKEELIKMSYEA